MDDDVARLAAQDVARLLLDGNGLRALVALAREAEAPAAMRDRWSEVARSEGVWAWNPDRPAPDRRAG